jgi:hypothetical protein
VVGLGTTSIENTYANKPLKENVMNLKLYAHNLLRDWDQFECYNWLIHKESRWNTNAINGSHYGLGQMRNAKVKHLSGRAQIRWHIRYINHRYDGDVCKALAHLEKRQWH